MNLVSGDTLGPYKILERIGEGGMGDVWKARDTRLDRTVAIKVSKDRFNERFDREAHAVAALNHPNICTLYDVGPDYLVMEFIEGTPLKGPMPEAKAIEIGARILDALEAAHKKGIVHRDLKPANILATKQGIKLLDFGIAKQSGPVLTESDDTRTANLTGQGQIVGTIQYMAPEQLRGEPAGPQSDIFSFGCVLYELLSGKRAFSGEDPASLIAAVLEREPEPLAVGPALNRVLAACLAKEPDARFRSAADLKRALLWSAEPAALAAATPVHTGGSWIWKAAAAVSACAALGFGAFALRGKPVEDARPVSFQIQPPPGHRFDPGNLRISPDGRYVAFIGLNADEAIDRSVWIRPLDSLISYRLAGTENADVLFWSPDSTSVGFISALKLRRIKVAGGTAEVVCAIEGAAGASWGEDGTILVGQGRGPLLRVPAAGGTPEPATRLDAEKEAEYRNPVWLPDGKHFIFRLLSRGGDIQGVYVGTLGAGAYRRLPVQSILAGSILSPPVVRYGGGYVFYRGRGDGIVAQELDGKALQLRGDPVAIDDGPGLRMSLSSGGIFATLPEPTPVGETLIQVDRRGARRAAFGPSAGRYTHVELSPDGKRLLADYRDPANGNRDVWVIDIARNVPTRLTFDPAGEGQAVWSPDGTTVYYDKGGEILAVSASGAGQPRRVATFATHHKHVSPDGKYLVVEGSSTGAAADIWQLAADGSDKPVSLLPLSTLASNPQYSPDGKWLLHGSQESGRREIYAVARAPRTGKWQISRNGGNIPRWRADGREIYFLDPSGKLMAVAVSETPDGALQAGQAVELFSPRFSGSGDTLRYAVSADGQSFFYSTPSVSGAKPDAVPITVITNWPATLRRDRKQ